MALRANGLLYQTLLLGASDVRFLRLMMTAAIATMAMTATMGNTVASATLPPWLSPEDLLLCVVEDWVCGVMLLVGVAAQTSPLSTYV